MHVKDHLCVCYCLINLHIDNLGLSINKIELNIDHLHNPYIRLINNKQSYQVLTDN